MYTVMYVANQHIDAGIKGHGLWGIGKVNGQGFWILEHIYQRYDLAQRICIERNASISTMQRCG